MTEADLPEVLAIERASFPHPWEEASFRAELGRPNARCAVYRKAGRVLGSMIYWVVPGDVAAEDLELLSIATHPDHRKRGIARALMQQLIAAGRSLGAGRIHLEVRRSNVAAVTLYEHLGFAHVAVRKRYYNDNHEDALVMQLALQGATA